MSLVCTVIFMLVLLFLLLLNLKCILQLYNGARDDPENGHCLVAALELFQAIFKFEELRNKIVQAINLKQIENIFCALPAMFEESKSKSILICASALTFLSSIARYDEAYLQFRDKVCSSPEIQQILAAGLYEDQARIQVLKFMNTSALSDESLSGLASTLSGDTSHQAIAMDTSTDNTTSFKRCSFFDLTKGGQVDELVEAAIQKLDNKEVRSLAVSTVMSLFEYKVSAASHTEQNLYSNVEIVRNYCSETQQKLLEIDSRILQMRQLLLKHQQSAEYLHIELQELKRIKEIDTVNYKNNIKKYKEDLSTKEKMLKRKQYECEDLKNKMKSLCELKKKLGLELSTVLQEIAVTTSIANENSAQINSLEQKLKETDTFYTGLREKFEVLDEAHRISKLTLTEHEAEASSLKKENATLERDIANLQMLNTAQKKTAEEKDQEIEKLREELSDLERIRNLIADISGGKMKRKD